MSQLAVVYSNHYNIYIYTYYMSYICIYTYVYIHMQCKNRTRFLFGFQDNIGAFILRIRV